VAFSQIAWYMR